jgi:hypothetical protein
MSDPLFIVLSLSALVCVHIFLVRGNTLAFILTIFSVSAAYFTRYAGLAFVAAVALLVFTAPHKGFARRFAQAAGLFIVGIIPTSIWFLRNWRLTGQIAGRTFGRNTAGVLEGIDQTVAIILNWFLPLNLVDRLRGNTAILVLISMVGVLGLILISALGYRAWKIPKNKQISVGLTILALSMLSYLGLIAYSYLFSRPGTDLIERTLSPLYPIVLAFLIVLMFMLWKSRKLWLRAIIVIACMLLIRNKSLYTYSVVDDFRNRIPGYTSQRWLQSETIERLKMLDIDVIYTDDIAAIYLLATQDVHLIPQRQDAFEEAVRADYQRELYTMRSQIYQEKAFLVLFEPEALPPGSAPFKELINGLQPVAILEDGIIYGAAE